MAPPAGATPLSTTVPWAAVHPDRGRRQRQARHGQRADGEHGDSGRAVDGRDGRRVAAATTAVVTGKVALVAPGATVTLAGTEATAALPLESCTSAPWGPATAGSVPVPCVPLPPTTSLGRMATVTERGNTLTVAAHVPPGSVAVTWACTVAPTACVVTGNVVVVAPAGTVALAGTLTLRLLLDSGTVCPLRSGRRPQDQLPLRWVAAEQDRRVHQVPSVGAGVTCTNVELLVVPPRPSLTVAVMVTQVSALTGGGVNIALDPMPIRPRRPTSTGTARRPRPGHRHRPRSACSGRQVSSRRPRPVHTGSAGRCWPSRWPAPERLELRRARRAPFRLAHGEPDPSHGLGRERDRTRSSVPLQGADAQRGPVTEGQAPAQHVLRRIRPVEQIDLRDANGRGPAQLDPGASQLPGSPTLSPAPAALRRPLRRLPSSFPVPSTGSRMTRSRLP